MNKIVLRPYQEEGVAFILDRKASLLAFSMGLGKTITSLRAIRNYQPTMIICPKSMKETWKRAVESEGLTPIVLEGRQQTWRFPKQGEVVILNPDILPKRVDLFGVPMGMYLIVDEVHQFKNPKLERSGVLAKLSRTIQTMYGRVCGMSGTPILKNPYDLYGILFATNLLEYTYKTYANFCREFGRVMVERGEYWKGPQNPWTLDALNKYMLRKLRSEVAKDIPGKVYQEVEVTVPHVLVAPQLVGYSNTTKLFINEDELTSKDQVALMSWRKDVELAKMHQAIDWIQDSAEEGPMVVFCLHKETAQMLGKVRGWGLITGDTSEKERQRIVDAHQAGDLKGIVGTIYACGTGLTLTKGNQVVFINRDWSPALNSQAEDRVCRMGQNRGVIITDIVSQSRLDKRIANNLKRKQECIDEIVEGKV
jgi:SWI/SNF-related matrix-associated actin-dependent regulator 1 of chromatin subfamily A